MPDLAESLIDYIQAHFAAEFPSVSIHVGEYIPQSVTTDYVWISQSSEQMDEEAIDDVVDKISFTLEIVADDIQDCRDWTASLKTAFRDEASHSAAWNSNAEFVTVTDANDDYIPVNFDADNPKHLGILQLTFDI